MSEGKLVLYGDYGSQPTRACFVFLKMNKVPFEFKEVRVTKLEQYTPEFKKVNPNAKVPAISDGQVNLFESHTILRYLHDSRKLADHWYPANPRLRAKVDEYLDWHHNGLRLGAGGYFFRRYISPMTGKPASDELIAETLVIFKKSLGLLENYWLKETPYLCGNEITIADLSAACELAQSTAVPLLVETMQKYPKVRAWHERMLAIPEMKEVHDKALPGLKKFAQIMEEKRAKEAKETGPKL